MCVCVGVCGWVRACVRVRVYASRQAMLRWHPDKFKARLLPIDTMQGPHARQQWEAAVQRAAAIHLAAQEQWKKTHADR